MNGHLQELFDFYGGKFQGPFLQSNFKGAAMGEKLHFPFFLRLPDNYWSTPYRFRDSHRD